MKNKIIFICLFFMLMAALPLFFALYGSKTQLSEPQTEKEPDCLSAAAALCGKDFCDEAIKAAAIITRTNAAAGRISSENSDNISDKELSEKVKTIYYSQNEILLYSEKPVYIPVSAISNGSTENPSHIEYLDEVASPWDAFPVNHSESPHCEGVSMNGIDYLCRQGLSAEDALLWYLPKLRISS